MNFTSFHFFFFFLVTILLGHLLRNRRQKIFLLGASYYFYGVFEPWYLTLILVSTIFDYVAATGIENQRRKSRGEPLPYSGSAGATLNRLLDALPLRPGHWLSMSMVLNLALLGYFKYTNFGIEVINDLHPFGSSFLSWPLTEILLPIGISFYTFQSMSYTIDVYRGILPARRDLVDFALYVSFFPQLVAGPIVRAPTFFSQLDDRLPVNRDDIIKGTTRIVVGFFRKLVLADNLAIVVEQVFANPGQMSMLDIWIGALAFGFQIYFDFAGYTDIARGVARLFGFEFEINFLYPMAAGNITDHWKRWHISLTTWIRDYVYIPLGGSRHGSLRTHFNLFAIWILTGIWHGASYHFIAWGIWQGIMLVAHRAYSRSTLQPLVVHFFGRHLYGLVSRIALFLGLIQGFIWFRADSMVTATLMQGRLIGIDNLPERLHLLFSYGHAESLPDTVAAIGTAVQFSSFAWLLGLYFAYDFFFNRYQLEYFWKSENRWKLVALMVSMLYAILVFSSPESGNFMYFQF